GRHDVPGRLRPRVGPGLLGVGRPGARLSLGPRRLAPPAAPRRVLGAAVLVPRPRRTTLGRRALGAPRARLVAQRTPVGRAPSLRRPAISRLAGSRLAGPRRIPGPSVIERRRGLQGVLVGALVLASGCVAVPGPPAAPHVAAAPAAPEVVPPQPGPAYVW